MNLPVDCEYDVYVQKLTFPKDEHARKYYQNITKQKSRTNSKGPNVFTDTYFKTGALKEDFTRYEEMMIQNQALIRKLNTIERNTLAKVGKLTDADGPPLYAGIYFKPYKTKQDYARFKEIMEGNVDLLQIINNIQRSTIKFSVSRHKEPFINKNSENKMDVQFCDNDVKNAQFKLLKTKSDQLRFFKQIMKAVTRTDAEAPNIATDTFFKSGCLTVDYNRFKDINKENFDLLQAINVIDRDTGRTENYNPNAGDYADRRSGPYIQQVLKFEKENHQLYKNILKTTGRLPSHKVLLKQWRENQHKIQFKARMPIALPYIADHSRIKAIVKTKRPIVFLDLANSNGTSIGRLRIVLYYDIAPKASMNFIELCVRSKKDAGKNKPNLSGTCFHRIFTDLYAEGGDMIYRNGCGGKSAEGRDFPPENFLVNHNCRGTLSMRPTETGYVNSIFTISFRPIPSLNGKRIAFGRVIQGLKNLKVLESFASKNGKPKQTIIIKNCGLLYNMPQHNSTSP